MKPTKGKSIVVVIDSVNKIIMSGNSLFMGKGVGADLIKAISTGLGSCGVELISSPSIYKYYLRYILIINNSEVPSVTSRGVVAESGLSSIANDKSDAVSRSMASKSSSVSRALCCGNFWLCAVIEALLLPIWIRSAALEQLDYYQCG
jgi:hypothetical protein